MSTDPVRNLADRLIREGYVDNEPDALLAAIRLQLAISERGGQHRRESRPPPGDDENSRARPRSPTPAVDIAELMMHRL